MQRKLQKTFLIMMLVSADFTFNLVEQYQSYKRVNRSIATINIEATEDNKEEVLSHESQDTDTSSLNNEEESSHLKDLRAKLCEQSNIIEDLEARLENLLEDKEKVVSQLEKKSYAASLSKSRMLYQGLFLHNYHTIFQNPFVYAHNPLSSQNLQSNLLLPLYLQSRQLKRTIPAFPSPSLGEGSLRNRVFRIPNATRSYSLDGFIPLQ